MWKPDTSMQEEMEAEMKAYQNASAQGRAKKKSFLLQFFMKIIVLGAYMVNFQQSDQYFAR